MIYIYRFIYLFLKSILYILKPFLSFKTKHWMSIRANEDYLKFNQTGAIWFHASSGELEYCKSVMTEIRKSYPHVPIVLSYSSPSAEKLFFNIKNQVDLIFPLPWDSRKNVKKVIQHLKPRLVVFSRTDFWPELIYQLEKNKVKRAAISMFPQLSFLSRLSYRWLIQSFDLITTVSLQKSEELSDLLNREVLTFADSRFDQVFNRLASTARIGFTSTTEPQKRIVFASTWPEDEDQILPCLPQIIKMGHQVILCPHEVKYAESLLNHLNNYKVILLSSVPDTQNISQDYDILLVDKVGYLADIYRFTDLAFVGGSFRKKIHSVMEPLCSKNVVFFGPYFYNNPEAVETEKIGLTFMVRNATETMDFIKAQTPDQLQKNRELTQVFAEKHRGSSILIAREIMKQI